MRNGVNLNPIRFRNFSSNRATKNKPIKVKGDKARFVLRPVVEGVPGKPPCMWPSYDNRNIREAKIMANCEMPFANRFNGYRLARPYLLHWLGQSMVIDLLSGLYRCGLNTSLFGSLGRPSFGGRLLFPSRSGFSYKYLQARGNELTPAAWARIAPTGIFQGRR